MPALYLFQRSVDVSTIHSPVIITGLTVIALILCGTFSWLGFRMYRKRAVAKRESQMGAAFPSVERVVHYGSGKEKGALTSTSGLSRHMINSTVVLPEKALIYPAVPRLTHFNVLGRMELPQSRSSVMSTNSVSTISNTSGKTRKVRQKFEPVLPDELLPVLGERLTVVQSFDDGWCVVGRENSTFAHAAISLFKSPEPGQNIELGVVPAWCFLKPVKGFQAERPIRSASLGIKVNVDGPLSRNDVISWANF